jgi:vWA-MoxR associated protein C-terminal domain
VARTSSGLLRAKFGSLTGVDGWQLIEPVFEESYVVGRTYRVIVRSSERMERKYLYSEFLNRWYANWEKVKTSWHIAPCENDFEHLEQLVVCNWERLEYGLMQKIGLKLTCGLAETQKKQLFRCILKSATPIALWVRRDVPECDQVTEIGKLLSAGPLLTLAETIRKKREDVLQSDKPEAHLGSHLALLWEDPYRLTPDALAQLQPPGK